MSFIDVMAASHLPQGAQFTVQVGEYRVLLCHSVSGIHAVEDVCSHVGMPLCGGKLEGDVIRCPSHGATFDVRTGKPTRARTLKPVRRFDVKVEGGRILINGEPHSADES